MKTCELCKEKFSNHIKINGKIKNLQRRKYCLTCSPWGKHNTLKLQNYKNSNSLKCLICEKELIGNQTKYCSKNCKAKAHLECFISNKKDYQIQEMQSLYDTGLSWRDVMKKINTHFIEICSLVKQGKLKSRTGQETYKLNKTRKPFKMSEERKKKISITRKKYIKETGKCNWSNKTYHNTSIPCETFKTFLKNKGIDFVEEYMPLKEQDRYFSIDIAFPEKKIGIEINGNQHYDTNGNLSKYYQDRHNLIENAGWKLFEIPAKKCLKEYTREEVLSEFINYI